MITAVCINERRYESGGVEKETGLQDYSPEKF